MTRVVVDNELLASLKSLAKEAGFARIGVARAEPLGKEAERLRAWLAEGRHGAMGYMADTVDVRANPTDERMLKSAKSIVVLAMPYARSEKNVGPSPGVVARYARGRDYHNVIPKRAKRMLSMLREQGHAARLSVDAMPVFERAWAERSGIGFIGKNCCLIIPGLGSHVFLAAIVTSAELPADAPMRERCGECALCLDACPTRAFVNARELDARKCISYLTIEERGPIQESLRDDIGDWIFGCDACQDICPYNRTAVPDPSTTIAFAPDERWAKTSAEDLLRMSEEQFAEYAHGSPLKRAGRNGLARNAAIVLGNTKNKHYLPILKEVSETHESDIVREAAVWAEKKLIRP